MQDMPISVSSTTPTYVDHPASSPLMVTTAISFMSTVLTTSPLRTSSAS